MKISKIDVYVLQTPLDEPFAFSQGWVHKRSATLVRLTTDTGLTGWGEAFTQGLEPPQIAAAAVEHALTPLLVNENPLDHHLLWHKMYSMTRDYGRKGSVMAAISAIDIALWDIAGKHYSQPIYQLLGGAARTSLQPYATGFYRTKGQQEAQRLASEAKDHRAAGFTAMKVKLGFGIQDDLAVMSAITDALQGNYVELMVDCNHAYGFKDALTLGHGLEQYKLRWLEEPVAPEDHYGYTALRERLHIPIAGGENEHSIYGFNKLFTSQAVDIAQPDIGSCGGFTAARDITAMAMANGIMVNPHVWGSAIAQAASVQLLAWLPTTHHSVYPSQPMLEYDRSSHPIRNKLVNNPLQLNDGKVTVPDKPGLGIEVQMDVVDQYRVN